MNKLKRRGMKMHQESRNLCYCGQCKGKTRMRGFHLFQQKPPEDSPKKDEGKWCMHIAWKDEIYHKPDYYFDDGDIHTFKDTYGWNNCPICGTPRPQPKELWEKIRDAWQAPFSVSSCGGMDGFFEYIAEIAEQHFKGSKRST